MQSIYRLIAVTSAAVLLFLNVVTIAIPPDQVTASKLAKNPDSWELVVDHAKWRDMAPSTVKAHLVSFLEKNRMPTNRVVSATSLTLVVSLCFSCIGWMRERKWNRSKS